MVDYTAGINNRTLKRNVGDVLKQYDKDQNGYTQAEMKDLIKGSVSVFGKPFISNKVIKNVQAKLDTNQDGLVTEDEINAFLKKQYKMDLDEAKGMTVRDLANALQAEDEARKKARKKK